MNIKQSYTYFKCLSRVTFYNLYSYTGADPGFQARGGELKKFANFFLVFRVKIHDFTPKKQITESPSYP